MQSLIIGHAAAPPTRAMNSRRLMLTSRARDHGIVAVRPSILKGPCPLWSTPLVTFLFADAAGIISESSLPAAFRQSNDRNAARKRRTPPHRLSWVNFHTFRHTYATWMRRYGGLDEIGLVATGNLRDPRSARRYANAISREEWSKVEMLPAIGRGKSVESG